MNRRMDASDVKHEDEGTDYLQPCYWKLVSGNKSETQKWLNSLRSH